jgi:signal transduction histidine kinase
VGALQNREDAVVEVLDALDAATRAIARVDSTEHVLQLIVDRVRPLVGARYAAIGTIDALGRLDEFITSGIDDETRRLLGDPPHGYGLLGMIVREQRSVRVPNIAAHAESVGFPPHHPPMTTLLGVPVTSRGRSVGRLYLTDKRDGAEFTEFDERLVTAFAHHAAIAIENARLYEQLHGLTIMEERERIGRDLHDGIIQQLYGIGLSLEDVPDLMDEDATEATSRVERAIDSLHGTIRDLRAFVFGLRPEIVEGSTLTAGIATLADAFRHNTLITPTLELSEVIDEDDGLAAELLAVTSEALSNIARHARASAVSVSLDIERGDVVLRISDDGVGLPDAPRGTLGHHGLSNMRERARRLGGRLEVDSRPGLGTAIAVRIPIAPTRAADGSAGMP